MPSDTIRRSVLGNTTCRLIALLIRWYQIAVSPCLGRCCRFEPSCSEYSRQCFIRYGAFVALRKTINRVMRCHPFCRGGYDPP